MRVPRSDDPWAEYDPESSGRDALIANSEANSKWIGKIPTIIATTLMILGTGYYAFHIFPPGNAEPLLPSSYAIARGMGHFQSDHIIIPIEWRNSGGQPALIRNIKLFMFNITDPSSNLSDKPELTYELAGEFAENYSGNIGHVGASYTLKQAYVIDPNTITPTIMVFHINNWWVPKNAFQFKKCGIKYKILLNYTYLSFGDLLGLEESRPCNRTIISEMPIKGYTVDLDLDNNNWDSYSTYVSTRTKSWLQFWRRDRS
jgi:hypothetical protein